MTILDLERPDAAPRTPAAGTVSVCHIIYKLDVGGLENGLVNLVNYLPADRYRHSIICLKHATEFARRIARQDVPVLAVHKREGKDPAAYGRVWRLLRRLRPDIVHTRNIATLDMLAPARFAGVPRLVHGEHGLDLAELDGRHRRYNRLRRLSRLVVDRYVAVSRDLWHWLGDEIGVPEARRRLIYNGVDTARFRPGPPASGVLPPGFAPPGAFVVGTIGRLEPVKDQLTLALAFVRVLDQRPDLRPVLRLAIIGDGSLRGEIESVLAAAGAGGLAWLPGFRSDAAELYRAFDAFVLPSRREGISNTLLEAMSSGRPIVATAVGGNPELVEDGSGGLLVPAADAEALAAALRRYVEQPEMARAHGDAARRRALATFSLEAMVEGYDRLYRDVARGLADSGTP